MSDEKLEVETDAIICDIDGPYYRVHMHWLPCPGDLIDLHSRTETAADQAPKKWYKVVQVVHEMVDATQKGTAAGTHGHAVRVHVKSIKPRSGKAKFFRGSESAPLARKAK